MKRKRNLVVDYFFTIAGAALMGFVTKSLYNPMEFVTGGFSGISIIVNSKFGVSLAVTSTLLNIPLFILAFIKIGWKVIFRSLIATITLSASLAILPDINLLNGDLLLTSIFGGVLMGAGLGMVLSAQATTGGSDLMSTLIHMKFRYYSVAQLIMYIDAIIIIVGASVFGLNKALYAIISVYVVGIVSDRFIEGFGFAKAVLIISEKNEEIARRIMTDVQRGVTGLNARGMYSNSKKEVLFCVVNKKEIIKIKDIVSEIDMGAFLIVEDAREVLGQGFDEIKIS